MKRCKQQFQQEVKRASSPEISGDGSKRCYRKLSLCFAWFVEVVKLILVQHKVTQSVNGDRVALSERWSEASVGKPCLICMGKIRDSWPSLK